MVIVSKFDQLRQWEGMFSRPVMYTNTCLNKAPALQGSQQSRFLWVFIEV